MKTNRLYFLIVICINLIAFVNAEAQHKVYINQLTIYGKSNVNDFNLSLACTDSRNELIICGKTQQKRIQFKIPVNMIQSNHSMLVRDFRTMVKANQYPYIELSIDLDALSAFEQNPTQKYIDADISIAGIVQRVRLPIKPELILKGFIGDAVLNLNDFDLKPIRKFMGSVYVENEIRINFHLTFNA